MVSIHLSLLQPRHGQIKSHTYLFAFESCLPVCNLQQSAGGDGRRSRSQILISAFKKTHVGQLLLKSPQWATRSFNEWLQSGGEKASGWGGWYVRVASQDKGGGGCGVATRREIGDTERVTGWRLHSARTSGPSSTVRGTGSSRHWHWQHHWQAQHDSPPLSDKAWRRGDTEQRGGWWEPQQAGSESVPPVQDKHRRRYRTKGWSHSNTRSFEWRRLPSLHFTFKWLKCLHV